MKIKSINLFFQLLCLIFMISACRDKYTEEYLALDPVYLSYTDFREAVRSINTQALEKPGKIYYKNNYLYINELMKGVHVYNNVQSFLSAICRIIQCSLEPGAGR